MDELEGAIKSSLFVSVSCHTLGLPASFFDIPDLKLYDVNGEGIDDWETILFRNSNEKEKWFYTRLQPNCRNGYCRTTSGGRRWHSRGKTDKLLRHCLIERTRFTLKYKKSTRSMTSSDAYTMFEYTTGENDQFALCKIIQSKKKAKGLLRRFRPSKRSTKLVPSLHAVNSPMGPSPIMGTNHEHVNNSNFYKGEISRSGPDDFMQEDGNVKRENEAADEIDSFFKAAADVNDSFIKALSVDDNTVWQTNQKNHAVHAQSMNNRNCSGIEIKEPTEGLNQSNDWMNFSLQNGGSGMNINEPHAFNSEHALRTSMPDANNLIDSSPRSVGCYTDFPSSLLQPNVDTSSFSEDYIHEYNNTTPHTQYEDYSGNLWNYQN